MQKYNLILLVASVIIGFMAISGESLYEEGSLNGLMLAGIPSSFDLRVLPTYRLVDFTSTEQGICVGGNFAQIISQTVSDYYTVIKKQKIRLSAQQLLECSVPNQDDICHHTSEAQINYALKYIEQKGLSTSACYPYTPLVEPSHCSAVCPSNKSSIDMRYKVSVSEIHQDAITVTNWIGNNGPIILVMHKHDGFNYYAGGILKNDGSDYGLVVLEVVGWKDKGNTLIAKSTFGPTWGVNGYVHISITDKTIYKLYGLSLPKVSQL